MLNKKLSLLSAALLLGCSGSIAFAETCNSSEGGWYCGAVTGPTNNGSSINDNSIYVKFEYPGYSAVKCVNNQAIRYSNSAQDTLIYSLDWWYPIADNLKVSFCPDDTGSGCELHNEAYTVHEGSHQTQVSVDITGANPSFFGCTPNWQD